MYVSKVNVLYIKKIANNAVWYTIITIIVHILKIRETIWKKTTTNVWHVKMPPLHARDHN